MPLRKQRNLQIQGGMKMPFESTPSASQHKTAAELKKLFFKAGRHKALNKYMKALIPQRKNAMQ